jgi:hypothetical protein
MALHQDTSWEVRTAGSANNGTGFHDRIPGTSVDYSQQNASQLSINDLVGSAASVTVTSAAAGFTLAMTGNVIRIRGGANFTVGFYEIVLFNAANSVNLDRIPCTGAGANGLGEVGGAQINCDLIDTIVVPGNAVYIKVGVYAAHPAVLFNQTYSKTLPLSILGYNAARGDNPRDADRPLIEMGANIFSINDVAKIKNIRFSGSGANIVNATNTAVSNLLLENCSFSQLAIAGVTNCLNAAGAFIAIMSLVDCEFFGAAGGTKYGLQHSSLGSLFVINCYFHNLTDGIFTAAQTYKFICFNVFANLSNTGINEGASATNGGHIINNTFVGIGRSGVYSSSPTVIPIYCMNNTFSDCVTAGIEGIFVRPMYNNFFNCGVPWVGGTLNPVNNNTFVAPQFFTPGSNYALQRTSGLIDRAFSMRLGV